MPIFSSCVAYDLFQGYLSNFPLGFLVIMAIITPILGWYAITFVMQIFSAKS